MKVVRTIIFFVSIFTSICYSQVYKQVWKQSYDTLTGKATFYCVGNFYVGMSTMPSDCYVILLGTGSVIANEFIGDGSKLTGISSEDGDNLGNHIATMTLNMNSYGISNLPSITSDMIILSSVTSGSNLKVSTYTASTGNLQLAGTLYTGRIDPISGDLLIRDLIFSGTSVTRSIGSTTANRDVVIYHSNGGSIILSDFNNKYNSNKIGVHITTDTYIGIDQLHVSTIDVTTGDFHLAGDLIQNDIRILSTGTIEAIDYVGDGSKLTNIDVSSTAVTMMISASNASNRTKELATYICNGAMDGFGDETEINNAIQDITSYGGRILLSEGTFYLKSPIIINSSNVCISGCGFGTIIIATGNYTTDTPLIDAHASGNKISDCVLTGNGQSVYGLYASGMSNFLVENILCKNLKYGITSPLSEAKNTKGIINKCIFLDMNVYGLYIAMTSSTVSDCIFNKCNNGGVLLEKCQSVVVSDIVISTSNYPGGIYLNNTDNTIISNCVTKNCYNGIVIDQYSDYNSIYSCNIGNIQNVGIYIQFSNNYYNCVIGNYTYNCTTNFSDSGTGTIIGSNSWSP